MSIEPAVLVSLAVVIAALFVVILLLLKRLSSPRRSIETADATGATPLERISQRLAMLERISGNLDELSRLFLIPHARGGLAETLLAELLHTWLPKQAYELQYGFTNGARADAVVKIGRFLVPVDAKFPLEQMRPLLSGSTEVSEASVRKTFMKHIEDIASKYIRPEEGTLEFALMYLPSEALYYRAFVDTDGVLMGESVRRGVVPVGPSGLFLYLQTVAFGLRGLGLSADERRSSELINQLAREFGDLAKSVETTTTHLRNAQRNSDELSSMTRRFASLLERLCAHGATSKTVDAER